MLEAPRGLHRVPGAGEFFSHTNVGTPRGLGFGFAARCWAGFTASTAPSDNYGVIVWWDMSLGDVGPHGA